MTFSGNTADFCCLESGRMRKQGISRFQTNTFLGNTREANFWSYPLSRPWSTVTPTQAPWFPDQCPSLAVIGIKYDLDCESRQLAFSDSPFSSQGEVGQLGTFAVTLVKITKRTTKIAPCPVRADHDCLGHKHHVALIQAMQRVNRKP